jgi:beta-barrel assembly-enhancing protease
MSRGSNMSRFSFSERAAASLVALLVLLPASLLAQTRVQPGFNMFSPQQDVEIGAQMAASADRQLRVSRNARIERVGARLAAHAPGPRFNYRFRVVDDRDLNAFALPGGYIYLNRGIIDAARNEGEIAGVLAHEIAHVSLRHGTHNASKANLTQTGAGLLAAILGRDAGPRTGQAINGAGNVGLTAMMLRYSRSAETQADILGAQILHAAGYNPQDMANFFRTLESRERHRAPNWLASHPSPGNRSVRIEQEARLLGARR